MKMYLFGIFLFLCFYSVGYSDDCGYKADGQYHCGTDCGPKADGNFHCGSDCGYRADGQFHCTGE